MLYLAGKIHPYLHLAVMALFCYWMLAAKSLKDESMKVYRELKKEDLKAARRAVSMIVGRDTDQLTAEGVTKAAVETVAENASDGVMAPLLYLAVGGPVLGAFYKAVNTMDSMVGYKNEKYLYFGRCSKGGRCTQLHSGKTVCSFYGGGSRTYRSVGKKCLEDLQTRPL